MFFSQRMNKRFCDKVAHKLLEILVFCHSLSYYITVTNEEVHTALLMIVSLLNCCIELSTSYYFSKFGGRLSLHSEKHANNNHQTEEVQLVMSGLSSATAD